MPTGPRMETSGAGLAGVAYGLNWSWGDGKVLLAGHWGVAEGYVGSTSLARLNSDGTTDLGFKPVLAKADGT